MECHIAGMAKQTSNHSGRVTVIHTGTAHCLPAYRAQAVLAQGHCLNLRRRQLVSRHEIPSLALLWRVRSFSAAPRVVELLCSHQGIQKAAQLRGVSGIGVHVRHGQSSNDLCRA